MKLPDNKLKYLLLKRLSELKLNKSQLSKKLHALLLRMHELLPKRKPQE